MAYSIDPIQENCYPGTTVLVNKLHIHDEAALQEAETLATYVNASKLEQCPLEGVFDFAHYTINVRGDIRASPAGCTKTTGNPAAPPTPSDGKH